MSVYPTCGRPSYYPPTQLIATAEQLIAAMREPGGDGRTRDVYVASNGSEYYLTFSRAVCRRLGLCHYLF